MASWGGRSPGRGGALQAIRFVVIMSASMAGALGAQSQLGITLLPAGARSGVGWQRGVSWPGNAQGGVPRDAGGGGCRHPQGIPPQQWPG